jgi:Asp-tRNA(Asn)/Glu-tRNA(Gln) amidotransferase A subunit family amidase
MNGTDPAGLSARAIAEAVREGRLTAREVAEACLARAAARAELEAWHCLEPDRARAAAEAVDARGPRGLIAGVPVGVKDIVETHDLPTECGSPIHAGRMTGRDAACVAALRAEGGVVLGKTATTEFAAYTPTRTRNPHDPGHTPGGSSSGSAAAVADFQVPLAIGTQTAGSVIRPASFCGVVGFKPTFGIIDVAGVQPFAASLDTVGVLARDVADAAMFVAAMASWPGLAETAPAPPRRVRVVRAPRWQAATEEAEAALDRVAATFANEGIDVDEADLPEGFDEFVDVQDRLQVYEGHRALRWEREVLPDMLSEGLRDHFARAEAMSFDEYLDLRTRQVAWRRHIDDRLADGELWLTLSAPGEAPEGLASTGDPVFCRAWTFLHLPCLGLPAGKGPKGLPLGVQLVGRRFGDGAVVAAASWLETRLG